MWTAVHSMFLVRSCVSRTHDPLPDIKENTLIYTKWLIRHGRVYTHASTMNTAFGKRQNGHDKLAHAVTKYGFWTDRHLLSFLFPCFCILQPQGFLVEVCNPSVAGMSTTIWPASQCNVVVRLSNTGEGVMEWACVGVGEGCWCIGWVGGTAQMECCNSVAFIFVFVYLFFCPSEIGWPNSSLFFSSPPFPTSQMIWGFPWPSAAVVTWFTKC